MTVFLDSPFIWYIVIVLLDGLGVSLSWFNSLRDLLECIKAVCVYISSLSSVQGANCIWQYGALTEGINKAIKIL